jgi:hypothetical protein
MTSPLSTLLLPAAAQELIRAHAHGYLGLKVDHTEGLGTVSRVAWGGETSRVTLPVQLHPNDHLLNYADEIPNSSLFRHVPGELHVWHEVSGRQSAAITYDGLRQHIPHLPQLGPNPVWLVTYAPDRPDLEPWMTIPEFAAWTISSDGARPANLIVEPTERGLVQLRDRWPVDDIQASRMVVVGVGSIGGSAVRDLAGYGVGHLDLIDPDRLAWHNFVRHTSDVRNVGRFKVDALKAELGRSHPETSITAHRLDVAHDADRLRPLLDDVDLLICAADGTNARRAAQHLARRAGIPAVLACVLDDGAVGEVLRLWPWKDKGCLLCHRSTIDTFDPEADQELSYGTGQSHRPMTALGPDLHLVASLTAKIAVATVLQAKGHGEQTLSSDLAVVGLRPAPLLGAPYNVEHPGQITWHETAPPRPGCPTCALPA